MKFGIYGPIDANMRKRVVHLESGTKGFTCFKEAEYLEEMLGETHKGQDRRRCQARIRSGEAGTE